MSDAGEGGVAGPVREVEVGLSEELVLVGGREDGYVLRARVGRYEAVAEAVAPRARGLGEAVPPIEGGNRRNEIAGFQASSLSGN